MLSSVIVYISFRPLISLILPLYRGLGVKASDYTKRLYIYRPINFYEGFHSSSLATLIHEILPGLTLCWQTRLQKVDNYLRLLINW